MYRKCSHYFSFNSISRGYVGIMIQYAQEIMKVTVFNLTEWLVRANDPSHDVFVKGYQGKNLLIGK